MTRPAALRIVFNSSQVPIAEQEPQIVRPPPTGIFCGVAAHPFTDENASMSRSLVTVATYWDPVEARLAKIHLGSVGVRSVLQNENSVTMNWLEFANASKGVQLQVNKPDVDLAMDVLERRTSGVDEIGDEWKVTPDCAGHGELESPAEPESFELDAPDDAPWNAKELQIQRAYVTAILGLLFLPLEFYATYQLGVSMLSDDPVRPTLFKTARRAIAINVVVLLAYFTFAMQCSKYGSDPTSSIFSILEPVQNEH